MEAWTKAYEADKVSIFGGIVAVNREVTREAAERMKPIFLEIIMAPKFSEGALEVLCTKKNLRLLEVDMTRSDVHPMQYVSVNGGLLAQELDVETKRAEIALKEAQAKGATEGLVMASDGFFPFDDCVTLAAANGVAAIVQPGGSVRDEDSIRKADETGVAMLFTGMRHFKH